MAARWAALRGGTRLGSGSRGGWGHTGGVSRHLRTSSHGSGLLVGVKRPSPLGGDAYGMPRKTSTGGSEWLACCWMKPWTRPYLVLTTRLRARSGRAPTSRALCTASHAAQNVLMVVVTPARRRRRPRGRSAAGRAGGRGSKRVVGLPSSPGSSSWPPPFLAQPHLRRRPPELSRPLAPSRSLHSLPLFPSLLPSRPRARALTRSLAPSA